MMIGLTADRLIIWKFRTWSRSHAAVLVEVPRQGISARKRFGVVGMVELCLANGSTLLLEPGLGPNDRAAIEPILASLNDDGGESYPPP